VDRSHGRSTTGSGDARNRRGLPVDRPDPVPELLAAGLGRDAKIKAIIAGGTSKIFNS